MEAIPETWTEPGADIIGAHFLSDGSIRFFRNFRLWQFNPQTDAIPVDAGGAHLSWLINPEQAIEIVGDRMAYLDEENGLYVSDLDGVRKFGMTSNGTFNFVFPNASKQSQLEIYNVFGEKVYSEQISNHKSVILNLKWLGQGIYFIKLNSEYETAAKKLTIQK